MNWKRYPIAASSRWNAAIWSSLRCLRQLNDGEQLYASSLPGMALVDRRCGLPGLGEVGRPGLAPDQVGVRGVGDAAGDRRLDAVPHPEEALGRPLTGAELAVALVHVARQQLRPEGIGAGDDERRHIGDVGGQPGRDERSHVLRGGDEHLAARRPHFFSDES